MTLYDVALWRYWPCPPDYVEEVMAADPHEAVSLVMYAYDLDRVARVAVRPVKGYPIDRRWSARLTDDGLVMGGVVEMPPPIGL